MKFQEKEKFMLENKLGIKSPLELAQIEEKFTKKRALELFETGKLECFEIGTFEGLSAIHKFLFQDIYAFAGKIRTENIAKNNFRFASAMYLKSSFVSIAQLLAVGLW